MSGSNSMSQDGEKYERGAKIIRFPDRRKPESAGEIPDKGAEYASLLLTPLDNIDPSTTDKVIDFRIDELLPHSYLQGFTYNEDRIRVITDRALEIAEVKLPTELVNELGDQSPKGQAAKELLTYEINVLKWRKRAIDYINEQTMDKGRAAAMMELFGTTEPHNETVALRTIQRIRGKYERRGSQYTPDVMGAERVVRAMFMVEPVNP